MDGYSWDLFTCPLASVLQVWNMNACNGVVGVFNLQGSSWDRSRRRFIVHDRTPPKLSAEVRPSDIGVFSAMQEATLDILDGQTKPEAEQVSWVAMTSESEELHCFQNNEAVSVSLAGGFGERVVFIGEICGRREV